MGGLPGWALRSSEEGSGRVRVRGDVEKDAGAVTERLGEAKLLASKREEGPWTWVGAGGPDL